VFRVANKSRSFKEAEEWNKRQYREMTPNERIAASRIPQRGVYGPNPPDAREGRFGAIMGLKRAG
jgi:hypothetical protein